MPGSGSGPRSRSKSSSASAALPGELFAAPRAGVARVALPLPVDRLFDYALPDALAGRARPGVRVRVPFESSRRTGVVVELAAEPAPEARRGLRAVEAVLDEVPVLTPPLLAILREEARHVLCPLGVALAAAVPPGGAPRSVPALALTARGRAALEAGAAPGAAGRLLEALRKGPVARSTLARRAGGDASALALLERDGLARAAWLERGPRARAPAERRARPAPGVDVEAACAGPLARAPAQAALLREIARAGALATRALARRDRGAPARLRTLRARGLVVIEERLLAPERPQGLAPEPAEPPGGPELTREQDAACAAIGAAVRERRAETFLLHGITGSGKTEVYLRAVDEALSAGRRALVLVPEIPLTHQIVGRLHARFGERLSVLHSGLRPGERLAAWGRLHRGETPIAVGARSALFAPLEDVGVIVIDEEHDAAYKNEEGFRYDARRLAARRARAEGCPLVLGSATPALETRHAAETGRIRRLVLPKRIGGRPLPAVEIVDLARERAALPRGRKLILGSALRRALREVLGAGGQALLFLNRRGFSTQIACFACGFVARCKDCDIALTYHAGREALLCHYCDHLRAPPDACPGCGAPDVALLGVGTERLEEEVRTHFPEARLARLDRDVAARPGAARGVLRDLRRGAVDVVVGTQMLAKGHDFPGVRLVGVVNADLGLHFPDFRAAERTFQLLTQVAGRAGRGATPGRVVIQTTAPEHYAVRPVARHDYERFYAEEIAHRASLGYPPFGRLARAVVAAESEEAAREGAERVARAARAACEAAAGTGACEVLGPAPAPLARLRGRHRVHVLLKSGDAAALRGAAEAARAALERLPGAVRASLDLDPVDML